MLASGPVVRTDSTVTQEISLPDIPALWDLSAVYLIEGPSYRDRAFVPYETPAGPGPDGLWKYQLALRFDQELSGLSQELEQLAQASEAAEA